MLDRQEVAGSQPACWKGIQYVPQSKPSIKFYIYVLYSEGHDKIYIGYSHDIEKRLASLNDPRNKGWTIRYQPWKVIYTEEFDTKPEALKREKQLKSVQGRAFIWGELIK